MSINELMTKALWEKPKNTFFAKVIFSFKIPNQDVGNNFLLIFVVIFCLAKLPKQGSPWSSIVPGSAVP